MSEMMRRVLVTGSSGMFGLSFAKAVEAAGHTVIRQARSGPGDVNGDLTRVDVVHDMLRSCRPDVVINLAALTNVDVCEDSPEQAYLANTRVVENLAAAIVELQPRPHFIQMSTDQVFDGPGPHLENDITLRNYYAFSKYAGELAAAGIGATVIRSNFFGRSAHATRLSFSDWVFRGLTGGQVLRVFDDVQFSPLSIGTLSRMLCCCIERPVPGVFNVGSADGMSKAAFCFAFAAALNLPSDTLQRTEVKNASLRARRPLDMRMNCTRFEKTFGIKMPSLDQEISLMKGSYDAGT
jgi:dTDP-4-dehydrorhamnose reductase